MLAIKVKSAVKCQLFTPPRVPEEPAPAAGKNPTGNTEIHVFLFVSSGVSHTNTHDQKRPTREQNRPTS